ncbi:hypothetical protein QBC47DRAFT_295213 [Echria macrotheca]|uniref:Uncharacterized protein n=1 Tax=Echria macrotheca TaxID=438768 RepID=A0AAJ0BHF0_9PEZI|nr:hypothetical protein QBC47DRAFT_295213 [Echria macrotheca]
MAHADAWLQAALVFSSTLLFVAVILCARATTWAQTASDNRRSLQWWMSVDVGTTILVVRVLQGLLTADSSIAISRSFMRLHWREMHKDGGLQLADLLALSPTTSLLGTIRIVFSGHLKSSTRMWAIARTLLTTLPWIAGVLLFARTSLITVFDTATVYDVTSGIGPFNASLVKPFLESLKAPGLEQTVIPYSYSSVIYNLIINPLFSTVADPTHCKQSEKDLECASYVLSGGLSFTAPWTPNGYPDHPLVKIGGVPTIQIEFQGRSESLPFGKSDCMRYGTNTTLIAAKLCLTTIGGSMGAGLFLCDGVEDGKCEADNSTPKITTTMSFARREATVLAARSNLTIMGVSNITSPDPIAITTADVAAYMSALSWLLDYPAANIPAASSIIEIFWSNKQDLNNSFADGILLQSFRSLLAFPVWLFNSNNYGNTNLSTKVLNPGLPPDFYTTAAVVAPVVKLQFDTTLLVIFICLQGIVLIALWISLMWLFWPWQTSTTVPPAISAFPVADFLFKASTLQVSDEHRDSLRRAETSKILQKASVARIYTDGEVRERVIRSD